MGVDGLGGGRDTVLDRKNVGISEGVEITCTMNYVWLLKYIARFTYWDLALERNVFYRNITSMKDDSSYGKY